MSKQLKLFFNFLLIFFFVFAFIFGNYSEIEAESSFKFTYTGNYQEITIPTTGLYKVQLWGASGGDYTKIGGYGSYTEGLVQLQKGQKLYVYVGQSGDGTATPTFNGGGASASANSRSGGGATDIRLLSGNWDEFESLKSRVMVAAGGGGASSWGTAIAGGNGGNLDGYNGNYYRSTGSYAFTVATGGTQISGGVAGSGAGYGTAGSFGSGGASNPSYGGGGGGGYYGGGGASYNSNVVGSGASGSSYISGYMGCNAINQASVLGSITHTGSSNHYSGLTFYNGVMIDGAGNKLVNGKSVSFNMPSTDGLTNYASGTGNNGNGYASISLVENASSIDNSTNDVNVGDNFTYGYVGNYQRFVVPADGTYNFELWGAVGGIGRRNNALTYAGGRGAYTKGNIHLTKGTVLYIYVGDSGKNGASVSSYVGGLGGYNGGGKGGDDSNHDSQPDSGGGGGGATDIRLVSGTWNNFDSLKSRIMVAAGGGGSSYCAVGAGGGTLTGLSGNGNAGYGTQTSGYAFGYAGAGTAATSGGGGGGSGWYGGRGAGECTSGASGSSFISGHAGALSINQSSISTSITHQTDSNHYSGYIFSNTQMIAGNASMPTYTGTSNMTGNASTGYTKITVLELDHSSSDLASLSINPGNLGSTFSSDIYEYDAIVKADEYKINISATPIFNETNIISGTGETTLAVGVNRREVVAISETGNISVYAINITRPASSYKYLDQINIDGVPLTGFSYDKFDYYVDLDFSKETVNIETILGRPSQTVVGDGVVVTSFGDTKREIDVISEDGLSTITYTVTFRKGHSSKLKSLSPKVGTLNPVFDSETLNYILEVPSNTISLGIDAIPYDNGATVTIKGNGYLKSGTNIITITVAQASVPSTVYTLSVTREGEVAKTIYEYACVNNYQEFIAPGSGNYFVELWGASGGIGRKNSALTYAGGKGAYTSGTIWLNKGETFYVYVGCVGANGASVSKFVGGLGGYNGGGKGGDDSNHDSQPDSGGGGGGATDIRLVKGSWNDFYSLKTRVMVAAGGGGSVYGGVGGAAGGLNGLLGVSLTKAATQIAGNQFGTGGTGIAQTSGSGGGGGGYYGGYTATYTGGGGGSSYISGYEGSNAISEDSLVSVINHTNQPIHYSNIKFENPVMLAGNQSMPNTTTGYMTGKSGNGYAKITMLPLPSENNFLTSITTNLGSLTPAFDMQNTEYFVTLLEDQTEIEVSGRPEDSKATVLGNGKYKIPAGTTVIPITVTAESGATRVYNVNVTRPASSLSKPVNIMISGLVPSLCSLNSSYCTLSSTFNPDNNTYTLIVPSKIKELIFSVEKGHYYQSVIGEGKIALEGGENNITIEVTSEDGKNTSVYNYIVTRDMTGNANIDTLNIINPSININFDSNITDYYFSVGNGFSSLEMEVLLEDVNASYQVVGNSDFIVGVNNNVSIVVTAVNGEKRIYNLFVYREQSGNTFISDLIVKKDSTVYPLNPLFNKTIFGTYTTTVPNNITSVEIVAPYEVDTTMVFGTGVKELVTGYNKFDIVTTAEDGSLSTYNLSIYREKSGNNNLSNLVVEGYSLKENFDSSLLNYNVDINPGVSSIKVIPTLEDSTAKYSISSSSNLSVGNNIIVVTVTAENGNIKKYNINVNRIASTNNYLSNIEIDKGVLSPLFDKDILEYNVNVDNEVTVLNVKGILDDNLSKVIGNGKYNLATGNNDIELQVTSEDNEVRTYLIHVNRKLNSNAYLSSITNSGSFDISPVFDKDTYEYTINVQTEVTSITINAIAYASTTKISSLGKYNLNTGNNDIDIKATAEDGTIKNYLVHVVRDKSTNDDLKYLFVHEGAISPSFSRTIINYEVKVDNNITSLNIDAIPEDSKATYEIIGKDNLVIGENTVIVRVTSEAGSSYTKDYILKVYRQELPTNSNLLSTLTVNKGTLTPVFNKNTSLYDIVLDNSVTNILVSGTLEDSNSTVSGFGTYNLSVGTTVIPIRVISTNGIEHDYQIRVERKKSSDASLSKLIIDSSTLSPSFTSSNYTYNLTTYLDKLVFNTITPTQLDATYQILGNENFVNGNNIVTIRVTAPDLVTTKDYILTVNKLPSNNNNLSSLTIDGTTFTPVFNKTTTLYSAVAPNNTNSIVVNGTLESNLASVEGFGNIPLTVGENIIEITVTSESGNVKKYIINVTREGDSNNLLADLKVDKGTLSPIFDPVVNNYTVTLPYEESNITIYPTLSTPLSNVIGAGVHQLEVGNNQINVIVTSESGMINTYVINVIREEIVSTKLKNISINNYDLDPIFDKNVNDYSVIVDNEITSLNITAETLDPLATYEIIGNNNFNIGINQVTILVTSSNKVDQETYTLNINRQTYSNTYLDYLYTSVGTLSPSFTKENLSYTVSVANNVTSIDINGDVLTSSSTVVGFGTYNLNPGDNKIPIVVTSSTGVKRTYYVNVIREKSNDNLLTSLIVKDSTSNYSLTPSFNSNTNTYNVNVPAGTLSVNIVATPNDSKATIIGTGNHLINVLNNVINVTVTSESGLINTYVVNVNRIASSNNYLTDLVPSDGELVPGFGYFDTDYTINVDSATSMLSFTYSKEDSNAIVTGTESMTVPDGISVRKILVTAEDGNVRTYNITVVRERLDNAKLKSLSVNGYTLDKEFNPDIHEYTINVLNTKKVLLPSEVIAVSDDVNAKITKMNSLSLLTTEVNKYVVTVTAIDGFTTENYTINVVRAKGSVTSLNSLVVSKGYLTTPFNPNVYSYTWKITGVTPYVNDDDVLAVATDSNAVITKTPFIDMSDPNEKHFLVTVTSEDGNSTQTYNLKVEYDLSTDATLRAINTDKGKMSPVFNKNILDYNIYVYVDETSINIDAILNDSKATIISGGGLVNLEQDVTNHSIVVSSEAGNIQTYNLIINKIVKRDLYLKNIELSGLDGIDCTLNKCVLDSNFLEDKFNYSIVVPYEYTKLNMILTTSNNLQTYKVYNSSNILISPSSYDLVVGENTFKVEVYDGLGVLTSTYNITIVRNKSNNTYLDSLSIESYSLDKEFDKDTLEYFVDIPYSEEEVSINAVAEDMENSTIEIIGSTYLAVGRNDVKIIVTSASGSQRIYIIHVNRMPLVNSYLKNITVSTGVFYDLSPNFNKTTFDYIVTVPSTATKITLEGVPDSVTTVVNGAGEHQINVGINTFKLTAVAEDSSSSVYNVTVIREKSKNVYLKSLSSTNGILSPVFNKDVTIYDMDVSSDTNMLNLNVVVDDPTATYKIKGNNNFITGINNVYIIVTSSDLSTVKTYVIKVNKAPSSNVNLSNITITSGEKNFVLNPVFDKNTNNYIVNVDYSVSKVNVIGELESIYSTVLGNGEYSLAYGSNVINLIVMAEDGNVSMYTININRDYNKNLTNIISDQGDINPVFNKDILEYTIDVDNTIDKITFIALKEASNVTVTGNGTYDLVVGENLITFIVTAPDGTFKYYNVKVNRAKSDNTYIKDLSIREGKFTESFARDKYDYVTYIPNSYNKVVVDVVLEDPSSSYAVLDNTNLVLGENIVTVRVSSPNLSTRDYKIKVIIQEAALFSNKLVSMTISNGTLSPSFDKDINYYAVTVPNSITDITINGIRESVEATVNGLGSYPLIIGKNKILVDVISKDGIINTYTVVVYRESKSDAHINSLSFLEGKITPIFDRNTLEYQINVASNVTKLTPFIDMVDSNATYKITGNSDLKVGLNEIVISTLAADKITQMEYKVLVNKEASKNNYLSSLIVEGFDIIPIFDKNNQGPYTVDVSSNTNSIVVDGILEDSTASISGIGTYNISSTKTIITVVVTSQSGAIRTYTVIVNKGVDTNSYLKLLSVKEGSINPVFDKNTYSYDLSVTNDIEEITITGFAESLKASVDGTGIKKVNVGLNTFDITVTSSSGTTSTYKLNVTREGVEENSSLIESLIVNEGKLSPVFNKNVKDYFISIPNEINSLTFDITLEDSNANYVINNNSNFVTGNNNVSIVVTNNSSVSTYNLTVIKQTASSNYLKSLSLNNGVLTPSFDKNILRYDVSVNSNINAIDILGVAESSTSVVTGNGNMPIKYGENIFYLDVVSSTGNVRTYTIVINRKLSDSNKLISLTSDIGTFDKAFSPNINDYILNVPIGTNKITLNATSEIDSTLTGTGTFDIPIGETRLELKVTSLSGMVNVYSVTVIRNASNNTDVLSIIPSSGIMDPIFDNNTNTYTINVDDNTTIMNYKVITSDSNAKVTLDSDILLKYGNNPTKIIVTAEDNVTSKVIDINVFRIKNLVSIDILDKDLIMAVGSTFNTVVTYNPIDATNTELLWESNNLDVATVDNGVITAVSKGSAIITVTSKINPNIKGLINVNVLSLTFETDVYNVVREEDPTKSYIIGSEPTVKLSGFLSNFKNNIDTLIIYDSEGNKITDYEVSIATDMTMKLEIFGKVYDYAKVVVRGDINGDGIINVTDTTNVKKHILNKAILADQYFHAGNTNFSDEIINVSDTSKSKSYILKKIDKIN